MRSRTDECETTYFFPRHSKTALIVFCGARSHASCARASSSVRSCSVSWSFMVIGRCHCRTTGGQTPNNFWITPPRFRAVNPSSDRNRDAKRFGHGVRREPRCWHQQRLRTTHIGTNYLLSRCPERPSNLVASGFLPTPSTANPASKVGSLPFRARLLLHRK